jgi:hypothetical protein
MAMASSAIEIRSPAVSSMSSSRPAGSGENLLGQVDQLVGAVAHRRDHDTDVVTLLLRRHDPLGHPLDPVGFGYR